MSRIFVEIKVENAVTDPISVNSVLRQEDVMSLDVIQFLGNHKRNKYWNSKEVKF